MKFSLSKPDTTSNQQGFGHIELLVLVVFIAIFAFVGVRVLTQSHADPLLTSSTCQLRGRVWASNGCTKTCLPGAGSHVVADPYDYCSNALSKISASTCSSLGRKYINVGCARRWQQTNLLNAYQCLAGGTTYTVANPYDKCVGGGAVATLKGSCKVTLGAPILRSTGGTFGVNETLTITNTGSKAFSVSGIVTNTLNGKTALHYSLSESPDSSLGTLAPGQSKNVISRVGYWPTDYRGYRMTTTLTSSSPAFTCSASVVL